jgi:hypothetical protein
MVRFGSTTNGEGTLTGRWGKPLPVFWKIEVLPAEEPGIDRPGAGSDHRQNGAEDGRYDGNPGIAGMQEILRESDPHFNDGRQHSRHWGTQTDQKKYPRNNSDDLQDNDGHRRRCKNADDPKMDERNARKHSQEQKTYAWPTTRERRE